MHAGILLVLLAETDTRGVHGETETVALIVMPLEPGERQTPVAPKRPGMRSPTSRPETTSEATVSAPAPPAPRAAIDLAAQAAESAARQIETDEQRARQARALASKPSPLLAARPKRSGFQWNYARTHRVEAVGGLATVIHLNDQCAIALFLIIPFAGGCALEKPAARGDLFEHLHDPEPAPEP
jgi:hypothetical protein